MSRAGDVRIAALLVLALAGAACSSVAGGADGPGGGAGAAALATPPTTVEPTTTTEPPPPPRRVHETGWSPFATVGNLTLTHPAARVEMIGFHQAGHDGARQMDPTGSAASPLTLEDRRRETGDRTAADVVVEPETEIRSPVSGRVVRGSRYVLYCKYSDDYVVIAPDAEPAWEVKILHIDGLQVRAGQRVTAGVTVLAPRATQLPFESQVDERRTAEPAWPHVHIEVVDPRIPDKPSPGGDGC